MIEIIVGKVTPVAAREFSNSAAGETTTLVTVRSMLGAGFVALIPRETQLMHLTSVGDRHVYVLTVRGYTVAQFVAIATAYAEERFGDAAELVKQLEWRQVDFEY